MQARCPSLPLPCFENQVGSMCAQESSRSDKARDLLIVWTARTVSDIFLTSADGRTYF